MKSVLIATVTGILTFTSWISISFTKLSKGKTNCSVAKGEQAGVGLHT